MPPKPRTWKAIADQHRKENFVGRAEQLRVFWENYAGDLPNWMVLSVTGEGGVGKSMLLKRYSQMAQSAEIGANVVVCDDHQISPVEVMGHVAEQLAKLDIGQGDFNERYKKYRELCQLVESDSLAPRSMVGVVTRGLTDFTIKSLRRAPGIGVALDYVDEKAASDAIAELVQYSLTRWGNKDEAQLIREPEKILTPLFVNLLNEAAEQKRLVLMLDVFERTAPLLSPWLLALFDSQYGELDLRISFILSGRDPLEQHWMELTGLLARIQLEPFTLEETQLCLSNQGITNEALARQIHQDTGGLPVLVELLAGTNPQPGLPLPDISKDAVERFLQWTPAEDQRQTALLAAIPRQFNQDILAALFGEDSAPLFDWLMAQSYIRSNSERGWFYHEKVRELMLRYLKNTAPGKLAQGHILLAGFFAAKQKFLAPEPVKAYQNEPWRRWELERLYHLFSAQPETNFLQVINTFLPALLYRWRFAGEVARLADQVVGECKASGLEKPVGELRELVAAYEKGNHQHTGRLLSNLEHAGEPSSLALTSLFTLRAQTYRLLENYSEALADFNRAVELDGKDAWAIASRGVTYQMMDKYPEALADFDRAIEIDDQIHWVHDWRGFTLQKLGRNEEAVVSFTQAEKTNPTCKFCIPQRGETYRLMGKYDEALADFNRVIAQDDKDIWAITKRGETYRMMGKYDEALTDFNRVIELDDKEILAIADRGMTYHMMGKFTEAQEDNDRVIELALIEIGRLRAGD